VPIKTLPQIEQALRSRKLFHMKRGKTYMPQIPPILHPKQFEREYFRDLNKSLTIMFKAIENRLISRLPQLISDSQLELATQRFDTVDEDLSLILDDVLVEFGRELSQDEIKALAKSKGLSVSEFNRRQNQKVYKRVLDVDVFTDEPWLENALENFASENAQLITTLSQTHVTQVRGIVTQGLRQGLAVGELAREIRRRAGVTKNKAKFIARDQISKLNGQLTRLRQQDVGITEYTWRTSLDERVRHNHRTKEGELYRWDDPPEDTGHPGEDFQCRCYAEPNIQGLLDDIEI